MKSLTELLKHVLLDCSTRCCVDTQRDYEEIVSRVKHEGLSFLTITLGSFDQDFVSSLDRGFLDPSLFRSFGKVKAIPKLFSGMLSLVFDRSTGCLLSNPDHEAILCIRQVCRMYKKILLECSRERQEASFEGFEKLDSDLDKSFALVDRKSLDRFSLVASVIWSDTFLSVEKKIIDRQLAPKHGGGKVADRLSINEKYEMPTYHHRLIKHFPPEDYCIVNYSFWQYASWKVVMPDAEQPVRVVGVPKTQSGLRVIGIEPACMQYAQQGLLREITDSISENYCAKGHVNFRDQSINKSLAHDSSIDGSLATIDLKDASDRIHYELAKALFHCSPLLWEAIDDCRSTRAELPNGTIVPLNKFACSGSALCFPVESMVFFTLLVLGELTRLNLPVTSSNVTFVSRKIYVYGDDIIVPVDAAQYAIANLEAFCLKVSTTKSFSSGMFRESCGGDYYSGTQVTPVYVRRVLPCSDRNGSECVSAISLANQLYFAGFWQATRFLRGYVRNKIRTNIPHVGRTCVGLGWHSFFTEASSPHARRYSVERISKDTHSPQVRAWVPVLKRDADFVSGHASLLRIFQNKKVHKTFFIGMLEVPLVEEDIYRSARAEDVGINLQWVQAY